MIVDDALEHFDIMREYCDRAEFRDYRNGPDGVVYPNICTEIPVPARRKMMNLARAYMRREPESSLIFMRLSPEGVKAPHQAHSDHLMGKVSVMLYLNRQQDCQGGTSLVRHMETGMETGDQAESKPDIWARDTNDPGAWEVTEMAHMKPNRAFVFDANRMHRAEPVSGFGDNQRNARLVLTGFFS